MAMLPTLAVGFLMVTASMMLSMMTFFGLESLVRRLRPWFLRDPHSPRLMAMLALTVTISLAQVIFNVWAWAWCYMWLGIFNDIADALYFSIVAFTTLGLNDVAMPQEWRLLGGVEAINGFIYIGMISAMILDMMRRVRQGQNELEEQEAMTASDWAP
ncbi:ion channel [Pseudooceanicola sp. HF7]|uniref:ion channel n=1 Tax=Pseudooceanicola sp. HF7 TaxID=2721560 RepID=UPI001C37B52A|nr:ion channel [Pseudooceanicola sp. HF7]